jgi:hypothetical protein
MLRDAEQIVRFWQAVEIFSPEPLPGANVRENVTDVRAGDPMPWEAGARLAERPPAAGKVWRHQVFCGLFDLSRVRDALRIAYGDDQPGPARFDAPVRGQSALFACTVTADAVLVGDTVVSPCARAIGQVATAGAEAVLSKGKQTDRSLAADGLARRPLTADDLREFAARLAERLGVASLLEPCGLRVRSYQAPAADDGGDERWQLLGSSFDTDLTQVADALRAGNTGAPLAAFLRGSVEDSQDDRDSQGTRIDVRQEPLVVRDGISPSRIPPGRWVSDSPLARSEQFAVNEIIRSPGLFAVHAPPGTGTVPVFSDLIAAIVVERARRLAELSSPAAAFSRSSAWGPHTVSAPVPALTGFEIVLAAHEEDTGLADIGARWRDRAAETDYFPSTARLADSDGTWALITARPGERSFVERFWHGSVRGTDVLFRAGESMPSALRRLKNEVVDWPTAVARFRAALAEVSQLSSERTVAAAALTRLSVLEQAWEEASSTLEGAHQRCADLAQREQEVRASLLAAEERRRASLADLAAHQADQPRRVTVLSGRLASVLPHGQDDAVPGEQDDAAPGLNGAAQNGRDAAQPGGRDGVVPGEEEGTGRRGLVGTILSLPYTGRLWLEMYRTLRAAYVAATEQRDAVLRDEQVLRADLAEARHATATAVGEVARLTADMAPLQESVVRARLRWGGQVPDGPSQAETEDATLIERREKAPAWADEEYAAARTELFLAALTLHKALIAAETETVERNLGALMDMLSPEGSQLPPEIALAAWQSFFLMVPVVRVAFEDVGSLFAGLGRGSIGWLLATSAGRLAPQQVLGGLWRANHAVLAGDPLREEPTVMLPWSGQQALAKALGAAEEQAPGRASAQQLADRTARYGTWVPAETSGESVWVGAPLRVRRPVPSPTPAAAIAALAAMVPTAPIDAIAPAVPAPPAVPAALPAAGERDDELLVFGALDRDQLHVHPGSPNQVQQVTGI